MNITWQTIYFNPASKVPPPAPGEVVSSAAHFKPLFRRRARQSMSFAFDLWSHDDARVWGRRYPPAALGRLDAL
jgi:hypothetical protein